MSLLASAPPADLLACDEREAWADPSLHPVWVQLRAGLLARSTVGDLVTSLAAICTGRARYLLAAKASRLALDDGKVVFADLHRMLTEPLADADTGWSAVAAGIGLATDDVELAREHPSPEVGDLVELVRDRQLSSAHEAVGVAWAFDRHLPRLCGQLADALASHLRLDESSLGHLRYQARRSDEVSRTVADLAERYLVDPWEVFEARLAAREVLWALAALLEAVGR